MFLFFAQMVLWGSSVGNGHHGYVYTIQKNICLLCSVVKICCHVLSLGHFYKMVAYLSTLKVHVRNSGFEAKGMLAKWAVIYGYPPDQPSLRIKSLHDSLTENNILIQTNLCPGLNAGIIQPPPHVWLGF